MGIFTRYILAEFLKVFLVTLSAMTLLMILVGLVKEALDQGLGLVQVARLVPYIIPNALLFTVPGTTLFAVSVVYGRMAGANEVVAIKSLGLHPMRIVQPCLWMGAALSLGTVWLNDIAWSWGFHGIQRVVLEAGEEIAYGMLRMHRSYSTRNFSINVERVEGKRLYTAMIGIQYGEGRSVTIMADEAELRTNLKEETLTISCTNAEVDVNGKFHWRSPTFEREISLKDLRRKEGTENSPSHMSLFELADAIARQELIIQEQQQEMAAQAAFDMLRGDVDQLSSQQWRVHNALLALHLRELPNLRKEPYRRWANGFSCLCFAAIGIPMAIKRRNSDFVSSFFACFLPILALYYPLLMFGLDRAKNGAVPPIFVWSGNVILLIWGYWLMRRVIRY